MKVRNMLTSSGNAAANQFIITGYVHPSAPIQYEVFQSYNTTICKIEHSKGTRRITLDTKEWRRSRTASKYRNLFLRETTKEIQQKVDSGEYLLADLNT